MSGIGKNFLAQTFSVNTSPSRVFELSLPLDAPEIPPDPSHFLAPNGKNVEPPGVEPDPPYLQVWSATATPQPLCWKPGLRRRAILPLFMVVEKFWIPHEVLHTTLEKSRFPHLEIQQK